MSQAATDPVLGPRRLDAEATLQATEFEDRLQAPAGRRDSITIAPATSEGVRSGHNRYAPEPDNMMIVLLLFLQKQNLAYAVYQFGSVLSLPD